MRLQREIYHKCPAIENHSPAASFFRGTGKDGEEQRHFQEKFLDYTKMTVEVPCRRKYIMQCHKCQAYNHSKQYCNHASNMGSIINVSIALNQPKLRLLVPVVEELIPQTTRGAKYTEPSGPSERNGSIPPSDAGPTSHHPCRHFCHNPNGYSTAAIYIIQVFTQKTKGLTVGSQASQYTSSTP